MIKVRQYSSIEEAKMAIKNAIEKKKTLDEMLRSGASREEMEKAGIKLVQFS